MNNLILSIIDLALASVFTFIYPSSGIQNVIIILLALIGLTFGIEWRIQYNDLRNWFSSKTIIGALSITISILILSFSNLFTFTLPKCISQLLVYITLAGFVVFLFGIYRTIRKNKAEYLEKI